MHNCIPSLDLAWEALADVVTSELRVGRGEEVKGRGQIQKGYKEGQGRIGRE